MNLFDLLILIFVFSLAMLVWQHSLAGKRAYEIALRHTRLHQVLLLDESIVLKRISLVRSHSSLFAIERQFEFEFSSLGDERYKGKVSLVGLRQKHIQLQAFKTDFKGIPVE